MIAASRFRTRKHEWMHLSVLLPCNGLCILPGHQECQRGTSLSHSSSEPHRTNNSGEAGTCLQDQPEATRGSSSRRYAIMNERKGTEAIRDNRERERYYTATTLTSKNRSTSVQW